jgi:DNA-binding transcriptional MerR regulator
MTAAELAAKVGVKPRTVRFYTAQGVLPSPEFRGAATRYGPQHLLCLAAIRWLQQARRLSLPAIRQHLRTATPADVQRMAAALLPELSSPPGATATPRDPSPQPPATSERTAALPDTWRRCTLLPGLELHIHTSSSAEVQLLARSLIDRVRSG